MILVSMLLDVVFSENRRELIASVEIATIERITENRVIAGRVGRKKSESTPRKPEREGEPRDARVWERKIGGGVDARAADRGADVFVARRGCPPPFSLFSFIEIIDIRDIFCFPLEDEYNSARLLRLFRWEPN